MVSPVRATSKIMHKPTVEALPQPARQLNLRMRLEIADRLLGGNGILPDTRLGAILAHPASAQTNIPALIRQVLSFERETHLRTCEIITQVLAEVEALSEAQIMQAAQKVVDELYRSKGAAFTTDVRFRNLFPVAPTVRDFAEIEPNGHFDIYQYFNSDGWGKVSMTLDYGRLCGYDQAISAFDLCQQVHDAYVLTRALEIL